MKQYHVTFDIGQVSCYEMTNATLIFLNDLYVGSSNSISIPLEIGYNNLSEIKNFEQLLYEFINPLNKKYYEHNNNLHNNR